MQSQGRLPGRGGVLDRTLKYRQNLNMGKETFKVDKTKTENLGSGGPVEPIVLGSNQTVEGSRTLGEKGWLFPPLPRIQGDSGSSIAVKYPKTLVNNTPLRRKKKYRKAVQ